MSTARMFGVGFLMLLGILGVWLGLYLWMNTYTYRYKLGLEVQVGDEIRSSYSVFGVRITENPRWIRTIVSLSIDAVGEAVYLDLGQGRNVILTFSKGKTADRVITDAWPSIAFGIKKSWGHRDVASLKGQATFTADNMPTMVTFSDLNNPTTGKTIEPWQFESVFGPDVHFKRAYVEMTRESVTRRIKSEIPWLDPMIETRKGKLNPTHPNKLDIIPTLFMTGKF